jgi:hypothetical protein
MAKLKYGKYYYKRLIKKSPHPEIAAPMVSFKPKKEIGGPDTSFEWCYISQPFIMEKKPLVEDLERFLVFAGGDPLNLDDFKAEIEISLGEKGEIFKFTDPRVVYIPRGLAHYPLTIKKVEKPLMMLNITSTQMYPRKEISDYGKYITAPAIETHIDVIRTYHDDKLTKEQKWSYKGLSYKGKEAAGGGLTLGWFPVVEPHIMHEVPHSHDFDMLALFLGSNPLNVGEFDAELDMWLGEEGEKYSVTSTSAVYHPKGLIHRQVDFQRIDKPFQEFHVFMAPERTVLNANPGIK